MSIVLVLILDCSPSTTDLWTLDTMPLSTPTCLRSDKATLHAHRVMCFPKTLFHSFEFRQPEALPSSPQVIHPSSVHLVHQALCQSSGGFSIAHLYAWWSCLCHDAPHT